MISDAGENRGHRDNIRRLLTSVISHRHSLDVYHLPPPPSLDLEMKCPGFVLFCFSIREGQAFFSYKVVDSRPLETTALRLTVSVTNVSQLVHCKTRGDGEEKGVRGQKGNQGCL